MGSRLSILLPAILMLKLKYVTKQSLAQKHQATVSHMSLQTMFIRVKNDGNFPLYIYEFFKLLFKGCRQCIG